MSVPWKEVWASRPSSPERRCTCCGAGSQGDQGNRKTRQRRQPEGHCHSGPTNAAAERDSGGRQPTGSLTLNERGLRVDAELLQLFHTDPDEADEFPLGVFTIVEERHEEIPRLPLEDHERVCRNG